MSWLSCLVGVFVFVVALWNNQDGFLTLNNAPMNGWRLYIAVVCFDCS